MNILQPVPMLRATQADNVLQAAFQYAALGLSVLPLHGKRPTIPWRHWQQVAASPAVIASWARVGLLENVGIVCGQASSNLVVLDLDDLRGYDALRHTFPDLSNTFTVATGSGKGKHLYFFSQQLPPTTRVLGGSLGNIELRAQGCQVVVPPSRHPQTYQLYRVERPLPIQIVPNLEQLAAWISALTPKPRLYHSSPQRLSQPSRLNPRVLEILIHRFLTLGFKQRGLWLNGPCPCARRHQHGDSHPSFGFNVQTGYGYCFVCGTLLAKDLCAYFGLDPQLLGGLSLHP
jgi:hypothetical protein